MSFPKQIAIATVVIAGAIGGLVWLGQKNRDEAGEPGAQTSSTLKPSRVTPVENPTDLGELSTITHGTRSLVPASAWLVADFRGDLTGNAPFSDVDGLCGKVPAPPRVALAVLPPVGDSGPVLLLAAPSVSETFWGCARDRIVRAGGIPLAQNDQFDVLKSPTGVVARGPDGSLVFLSDEAHLEVALGVLSGLGPNSANFGAHAKLLRRMHPDIKQGTDAKNALDLTLALPPAWLSSVGEDAEKSPLRHISAAFISLEEDGGASGGIDCDEAGCPEVLAFLTRAQADLSRQLPEGLAQSITRALHVEHVKGAGRISVRFTPTEVRLQQLFGQFFGSGPLMP